MRHIALVASVVLAATACTPSAAPAAVAPPPAAEPAPADATAAAAAASAAAAAATARAAADAAGPAPVAPPAPADAAADADRHFDFAGAALATIRAQGRAATPELRDAARRIVDAAGKARGCGTYPEGDRVVMIDLDGRPGDEALLLYTLEGCEDMQNYYERSGYVLRDDAGQWRQVAEFSLGTRLVGGADITSIAQGTLVVTPEEDSLAQAAEIVIAP